MLSESIMQCDRHIAGKTLTEIEEELSKPLSEDCERAVRSDGLSYIPVEVFRKKLRSVFGIWNYSYDCVTHRELIYGKMYSIAKVTLSIKDDNGKDIIVRSVENGVQLREFTDSGTEFDNSNCASIAESYALKHLFETLGSVFSEGMRGKKHTAKSSACPWKYPKGRVTENFKLLESFSLKNGNRFARAETEEGNAAEVIIFSQTCHAVGNYYRLSHPGASDEEALRVLDNEMAKDTIFKAEGEYQTWSGKIQFVLRSFV